MEIRYLGHAGFCVETRETIVIADPWLSPNGAFDGAWFQFPRNHHLGSWVRDKLSDASKQRFLYISHEHKDHFDRRFLDSLPCRDFTLVIPTFRRAILRESLADYGCEHIMAFKHEQVLPIPGGELTLYVDDSELNRDSAILIRADNQAFLNMNDCKLYDTLPQIKAAQGPIDAFACQFSGATWHPTCYDYPRDEYARVSKKKREAKYETVARSIETLRPTYYLPSAGPACFLDPQLMHLNFEPESIFLRAHDFLDYLDRRLPDRVTEWNDWMPGDSLDLDAAGFVASAPERVTRDNCAAYLQSYADDYAEYFAGMQQTFNSGELAARRERLRICLLEKLEHLPLRERVPVPLYFGFTDVPAPLLRVDFPEKRVTLADSVAEQDYYSIIAPRGRSSGCSKGS